MRAVVRAQGIRRRFQRVNRKPAFMARIEAVAGRKNAREQRLAMGFRAGGSRCFRRFLGTEHGPICGPHARGMCRLVARDLAQMTDVAERMAVAVHRAGTGHVDGHETLDAARLDGIERERIAADLFGHGEDIEAQARGLRTHEAGVRGNPVQIKHIGVRRNFARLVQRDRGLDERPVARDQGF